MGLEEHCQGSDFSPNGNGDLLQDFAQRSKICIRFRPQHFVMRIDHRTARGEAERTVDYFNNPSIVSIDEFGKVRRPTLRLSHPYDGL